jgi:phosphatidylserine/phosphatidylglycerophosphate/cardiolipin synthase-like enzyme
LTTLLNGLAAALASPALLLGGVFPGYGTLPEGRALPAETAAAIAAADIAPETGGRVDFNDPTGSHRQQFSLVRRIDAAIRSARPGSVVRLAAYSLGMPPTATALIDAHERGVQVRVVVDDHAGRWPSVRRLRDALGQDTAADSYVAVCRMSCRGGRGNQHAKLLTVSSSERGDGLVLVGSVNLTGYSAQRQWNDLYTVVDPAVHDQLARFFDELALDRPQGRLRLPPTKDGFTTDVSPYPGVSEERDPLRRRLEKVRCEGTALTAGRDGRTVVRILMHAWNGRRGVMLAHQVARLERDGCDVKVLYGVGMGRQVAQILRAAGVPTRDSLHEGTRVHEKVMVLSGRYGRRTDAQYVWTGSHNWSDRSLRNDELMLRVAGRDLVDAYLANFRRIWRTSGGANAVDAAR